MTAPPARCPWRGLLLIWLAALALDLWGIQHGPLRDWDESLVARVALELSDKPWPDWLLPSLWGDPYRNKPPGAHWLIAGLIRLWRGSGVGAAGALPPEWLLRLAPALGSSLLSPLLALVQWQLRPGCRADALWTGAIALTLLPLARHAHLAMLDGLQLTAMAALWLGVLLARPCGRRSLAAGLVAGLAGSLLLLLKAPVALPVLLLALALRWADRDLGRRPWRWLLLGLALGLLPGLAWHGWHLAWRGDAALLMWGRQGLARVTHSLENHGGGPLPPLIQVLSGGWPWLPLWPAAIGRAWRQRGDRWGRWCLGLTALATLMVLPLQTQLPWYSLLLWPPFALCCGPAMAALVKVQLAPVWQRGIPRIWLGLGMLVLALALLSRLVPGLAALRPTAGLAVPGGMGLLGAGLVLAGPARPIGRRRTAAWGLVLGWSLSLLLLFSTPLWNWELNERPPIQPLLPLVRRESRRGELAGLPLLVEGGIGRRPSLRWYAQDPLSKVRTRDAGALLLVNRAASPEQSDLAERLGSDRINGTTCRLERSGPGGWKRWLCRLP
ncbi:MAG: 4-amino-4-deoxy-L-arabinose transferase [Synechococcaceae cyanobacterium]|nr:4-amino-4-deoxy-L-arabinose transferase [Synechococcaceae cyanobacterium]